MTFNFLEVVIVVVAVVFVSLSKGAVPQLKSSSTNEQVESLSLDQLESIDGSIAPKKPPHVLIIVADDFGWHNAGFHPNGPAVSDEVQTLNLNSLAKNGVVLDRFYAFRICAPSRSSLQTGRLPVHVNSVNLGPETVNPKDPVSGMAGIPTKMTGIATRLREAGYRTHLTGKWDVGMAYKAQTPLGKGYETWLGYYHHANSYWSYGLPFTSTGQVNVCFNLFTDLSENDEPAKSYITKPATYEEEVFAAKSLEVIKDHNVSEPLFLVHSFHLIHTPLQVPQEYLDQFSFVDHKGRRKYASMVFYMDQVIGKLVEALQLKDMYDDTLIWFFSDNGGPIYSPASANNYPLRGGKYSSFEGGVRVNALVSGGWIPEERRGKVITDYMHIADVYTTLCALAGLDPTDKQAAEAGLPPVDGINQLDVILGKASKARTEIHLDSTALIRDNLKIVTGSQVMNGWTGPFYPNTTGTQPGFLPKGWNFTGCRDGCLFDIINDPSEHEEVSGKFPNEFKAMKERLVELNKDIFNPNRGKESFRACVAAIKNGGFYVPFMDDQEYLDYSSVNLSEWRSSSL